MQKILFFVLISSLVSVDSTPKLVKTKISDDIQALLPKNFVPMGELDFQQRYPSVRKPIGAFTSPEHDVDFSVNISATRWPDSDLEIAKQFFKSSVLNIFDGVDMIKEGIQEVNGKQFIYFEFESRVKGDKVKMENREPVLNYTYIQYLVQPNRTLVFSFNCPRRMRADWQDTADKVMKSLKIK